MPVILAPPTANAVLWQGKSLIAFGFEGTGLPLCKQVLRKVDDYFATPLTSENAKRKLPDAAAVDLADRSSRLARVEKQLCVSI